jgi:23S rRNA (uracil1939-C5)-methyltransferase
MGDPGTIAVQGNPLVTDELQVDDGQGHVGTAVVRRSARAFFQGNRFLLAPLVNRVVEWTNQEPVADLYAGVGLFAIALAAAGRRTIVAVEGDAVSGADLEANAASQGQSVRAVRAPVEDFLRRRSLADLGVAIVDPPRTGLSAEARAHLLRMQPARLIYVSCDAPTLARDVRALVGEGYDLTHIEAFDLFPNTAHVEILTVFDLRHA